MSEILVVGGAGYIGSHVIIQLLQHNYKIVVLDDLSTGSSKSVLGGVFYQGCLSDRKLLKKIFSKHSISCVILLAGSIDVAESIINPIKYYFNNVSKTLILLEEMIKHNILKVVFSSTASVFASETSHKISPSSKINPINPYAKSKLMLENILKDFDCAYKLKNITFRFFNAAGADPNGRIGYHEPTTHLIPRCLKVASGRKQMLYIYGNDYSTEDGTCVRDYIHVVDLAIANIKAIEFLSKNNQSLLLNLGSGKGHSIKEIIKTVEDVTNVKINQKIAPKRKGDPSCLVADTDVSKNVLGWSPEYSSIEKIIRHSWQWEENTKWHL